MALVAGQTLQTLPEIGNLLITARDGRPVYVRDVAKRRRSPPSRTSPRHRCAQGRRHAGTGAGGVAGHRQAPGTNAVVIAENVVERLEELRGRIFPEDVEMTVTRDYGETANEKANELLFHLGLATISIVLLVAFSIGWREAIVVAIVIPTTILLTLFASRMMGYTLNRVSLFALIFSIGILVDDAIVVIENIARHWAMYDGRSRRAGGDRGGRRGRQPDHRGDADRRRGAAADALRLRPDGPLYEPDPGQCLGRDAVLLLRRGDADAVADDATRQTGAAAARGPSRPRCGALGRAYIAVARPILPAKAARLDVPGHRRRR